MAYIYKKFVFLKSGAMSSVYQEHSQCTRVQFIEQFSCRDGAEQMFLPVFRTGSESRLHAGILCEMAVVTQAA